MGILEVAAHQLMLSLWLVIAFVQGEAWLHMPTTGRGGPDIMPGTRYILPMKSRDTDI